MFIIDLLVGIVSGFLAGLLGVGGGILFSTVLFYLFTKANLQNSVQWTVGSSLFCVFTTSISSVYKHYNQENIFWKESLKIGSAGILGTVVGTLINRSGFYNKEEFVIFFCLVLGYAAYSFVSGNRAKEAESTEEEEKEVSFKDALLIGGLGGCVASLAGVGGGIVLVPFLTLVYHKSIYKTVSISAMSIVIISLLGWLQFAFLYHPTTSLSSFSVGFVDFGTALPLVIGGLIGARIGVWANSRIKPKIIHWTFATFAFLVAVHLLWTTYF